jgi:hypothetical protein
MRSKDEVITLIVQQKNLAGPFANNLQRGFERASQDFVKILCAIHLGSNVGQGSQFCAAAAIGHVSLLVLSMVCLWLLPWLAEQVLQRGANPENDTDPHHHMRRC